MLTPVFLFIHIIPSCLHKNYTPWCVRGRVIVKMRETKLREMFLYKVRETYKLR